MNGIVYDGGFTRFHKQSRKKSRVSFKRVARSEMLLIVSACSSPSLTRPRNHVENERVTPERGT